MNIEQTSSAVKKSECPVCQGTGRYIAHRPECTDLSCQFDGGAMGCPGIMIECHACVGSGIKSSWALDAPSVKK